MCLYIYICLKISTKSQITRGSGPLNITPLLFGGVFIVLKIPYLNVSNGLWAMDIVLMSRKTNGSAMTPSKTEWVWLIILMRLLLRLGISLFQLP